MKNKVLFLVFFLTFIFSMNVSAYTLDDEGRAQIYSVTDLQDALKVFNGRSTSFPEVTSNPPTFILKNDIYMNVSMDSQDFRLKGGTATNPTELVLDGNRYKYTYGNGNANSTFLPYGDYISMTFQNMNIGNVVTPTPVGTPDINAVNYPSIATNQNLTGITHNYYGLFYCSGRKGISINFKNVNYVAAAYGQMLYVTGGTTTAPNTLTLSGNNNIIYPSGATTNAQELAEGITQVFVKNGTTNIQIRNNNCTHAIFSEVGFTDANNPLKLEVDEDATLNFSDNGKSYQFYYNVNTSASCIWNINGEANFDFTGCTRPFFGNRPANFQLNVGENAKFTTKGGLNWNIFYINNGNAQINAAYNSYIDWERNNGRIFTGTPNATNSKINLHNPRFAAFRSNVNNTIFGTGNYDRLKINIDANMAAYAYSIAIPDESGGGGDGEGSDSTGLDGKIVESDLASMVRAIDHDTILNGDLKTANDLIPTLDANSQPVLEKFRNAKAIFFKKAGMWWVDRPGNMVWNYSLNDIFQQSLSINNTYNSDFLAPRNHNISENNTMKLTIRDDGIEEQLNWYITVNASTLTETTTGQQIFPLLFRENDGTQYELNDWYLHSQSSVLQQGTFPTDKTVSYDASHGVVAKLNPSMKRGDYKGMIDWTLVDAIDLTTPAELPDPSPLNPSKNVASGDENSSNSSNKDERNSLANTEGENETAKKQKDSESVKVTVQQEAASASSTSPSITTEEEEKNEDEVVLDSETEQNSPSNHVTPITVDDQESKNESEDLPKTESNISSLVIQSLAALIGGTIASVIIYHKLKKT